MSKRGWYISEMFHHDVCIWLKQVARATYARHVVVQSPRYAR